jgi:hypothetical protein
MKVECNHEWKKTLAKHGMWFIDMCHKYYGVKSKLDGSVYYPIKNRSPLG